MKRIVYGTAIYLLLAIAPALLGQSTSTGAQLSGTILDPRGAVVPGAKVTLRSNGSGMTVPPSLIRTGDITFSLFRRASDTLAVEAPGFQPADKHRRGTDCRGNANLPVTLQLAGVSQELIVTADAEWWKRNGPL